jgi:hypothetical protein
VNDTDDGTVLKQIIIFGRHGVRSPTVSPADYARFSPRPYPDFGVPPERLLTGDAKCDASRSYFRANSIQRSNVTAAALGAGLLEGMTVPVHSYPLGQPDPAFDPISAKVAAVDAERAAAEVRLVYNSGAALASAFSGEFSLIRSVLFDYQAGVEPPRIPGAFAGPEAAVNVIISSDAYVIGLSGLLGLHWQLPGYLASREPPETISSKRLLRRAIGSQFVEDPASAVPPGVLTGVPLK